MLVSGTAGCAATDATDDPTVDDPAADDPTVDEPTSVVVTGLAAPAAWDAADCTYASGAAWANRFVAQRGGLTFLDFIVQVGRPGQPPVVPVDAVVGIADGPATAYSRLGAIIRFNPDGFVDARDGDHYAAAAAFAYTAPRAYRVGITTNVSAHTYRATITDVATGQSAVIADNYAFRTEQATMGRFDVVATKVDSAGEVAVCDPGVSPPICDGSSPGAGWKGKMFPRRTTPFRAEVDLFMFHPGATDMVVGLAGTQPARFSDLAAILRLNSDGNFDVRDGNAYRADAVVSYLPDIYRYRATFEVDPVAKRYSVWIRRTESEPAVLIADRYAFRTEQANLAGFGFIGQYMEPVGEREVQVCDLAVSY